MSRITPFKIGKKFVKIGDWIRFGYKKVWHIQSNNHITATENIVVVCNGFCVDGYNNKVGPLVVKSREQAEIGLDLGQVIAEYSNPYGSTSMGDGNWQYAEPYIEFYKHEQKTKRS